jgi:lipoate---protein ligase
MHGTSRYKVPGGKLVEARVSYNSKIEKVEILGDFFLYPEEGISEIELALEGIEKGETEEAISERIRRVVEMKGMELIGVTPESMARAIRMAVGN